LILAILLCAALVLLSGCGSEKEDLVPSELNNAYEWGEFAIGGKTAMLYADLEEPIVSYTNLIVYFPNATPSDPENSNTRLSVFIHLEDVDLEDLEGTVFDDLPDGYILGGPSTNPAVFDNNKYYFSTAIAPYIEGDWTFEFVWTSPDVNVSSYMPIEVQSNPSYRAIITAGTWQRMIVLAWIEPKVFRPGSQPYRIMSWRSASGSQRYVVDSTLTIELSVTVNIPGYNPDTSIAEFEGGAFVGNITLPELDTWKIQARTFDDTVLVGQGDFIFDMSSYKGD